MNLVNLCKKYNIKIEDMKIFSKTIVKSLIDVKNIKDDSNEKIKNIKNYVNAFIDLIENGDI